MEAIRFFLLAAQGAHTHGPPPVEILQGPTSGSALHVEFCGPPTCPFNFALRAGSICPGSVVPGTQRRDAHTVAAFPLRTVERLVGALQDRVEGVVGEAAGGNADA